MSECVGKSWNLTSKWSAVPCPLPLAAGTHSFFSNARLKAASQEAESVRRDQTVWERKVGVLQARCTTLEEEKYEALAKVRESVQVAEEAALQKDQVTAVTVFVSSFLSLSPPHFLPFSLPKPFPSICWAARSSDNRSSVSTSFQHFRTLPTEMCSCVCLYPLPSGSVKRETEDRGAGEDKGGHQTVNPGRCSPHQKRGAELLNGFLNKNCWAVSVEVDIILKLHEKI